MHIYDIRPRRMLPLLRPLTCFALLSSVFLFAAASCPQNPTLNSSGPSMVTVIQIGSPPPDTMTNAIDLNAADVKRSKIPSGIAIRLIANIASDTPITEVGIFSRLNWQCSDGDKSKLIGVPPVNTGLHFAPEPPPPPYSTTLKVDGVVDPIAEIANLFHCSKSSTKPGVGPVNISGDVHIEVSNSAGTSTSKTFTFDYQDVGQ